MYRWLVITARALNVTAFTAWQINVHIISLSTTLVRPDIDE